MEQSYHKKYYEEHKNTYYKEYCKKYYQDNKKAILEYQNEYNEINRKKKGRLLSKRELIIRNLKKNEKKVEIFMNLLNNNK